MPHYHVRLQRPIIGATGFVAEYDVKVSSTTKQNDLRPLQVGEQLCKTHSELRFSAQERRLALANSDRRLEPERASVSAGRSAESFVGWH